MIQNKESLVYSLENSINNLEVVVKESVKINTPQQREVYDRKSHHLHLYNSDRNRCKKR